MTSIETNVVFVPALVARAEGLAHEQGFDGSCRPEVGRLLRTLAAHVSGPLLELGSGCGVGTAWLLSAVHPSQRLVSIDLDAERQTRLRALFSDHPNAAFPSGDWREALGDGPFDLVFVDVAAAKDEGANDVIRATTVGGLLVLDDFEPGPLFRGAPDPRWQRWMGHPDLASCEVRVAADHAVILATRLR